MPLTLFYRFIDVNSVHIIPQYSYHYTAHSFDQRCFLHMSSISGFREC